jgi:hypothetical protein
MMTRNGSNLTHINQWPKTHFIGCSTLFAVVFEQFFIVYHFLCCCNWRVSSFLPLFPFQIFLFFEQKDQYPFSVLWYKKGIFNQKGWEPSNSTKKYSAFLLNQFFFKMAFSLFVLVLFTSVISFIFWHFYYKRRGLPPSRLKKFICKNKILIRKLIFKMYFQVGLCVL